MLSRDNNFILIFNGEIVNYIELISEFSLNTKTTSDTEVLLELYAILGPKAFDHCRGMFAGVIYDKKEDKLILFRDRFGVKPLFYYYNKFTNQLISASEIKTILKLLNGNYSENINAIRTYLKSSLIDHSNQTFYNDIYSLDPGNLLIFDRQAKTLKK